MSPTITLVLPDDWLDDCAGADEQEFIGLSALYLRLKALRLEDLEDLAFRQGARWDDLPGDTSGRKARGLVEWCRRHGRVDALIELVEKEFPNHGEA